MRVLVLNGVNLDILGRRDPALYGGISIAELESRIYEWARERGIDFFQPARLARREDGVREQPPRTEARIHFVARGRHLLVGEEPVLLDVGRGRRYQRNLGVAVEEHLLLVVIELQVLDGLLAFG